METEGTPGTGPAAGEVSPRQELLQLVRSLRAYVEDLEDTGAWGVPVSSPRRVAPAAEGAGASPAASQPSAVAARAAGAHAHGPAGSSPPAASSSEAQAPSGERAARSAPAPAARFPLAPAARARLETLAADARACTRCPLHAGRHNSVFSRGGGSSGLAFVGEGPGEEEDRQGLPFVGPAGQLLDRMIAAMQLSRDDVYVCNIVKCRPPKNRKPEPAEMAACSPFLAEQLELIAPRVIIALGATAVHGLLGSTEGITRMRGQWKSYRGVPVMPTFHPAYLLRTPAAKRDVWRDLQEVLRKLQEG